MFFVNLKAHYEELSVYEQEVIDYLMKQDNIEAQTLKSIGAALHLSASTIVRAGKKLGYATFNELKYDLRRSKESNQESHHLQASHFDLMKDHGPIRSSGFRVGGRPGLGGAAGLLRGDWV